MPELKPRILVLINPTASRAKLALPVLSKLLTERSRSLIDTERESWPSLLAQQRENCDLIVIGGGDGTISNLLPDLLRLRKPFAVLPLGTANDFARTIGLPDDPLQAAEIALTGTLQQIDVGIVNDVPYVNVASIGLATKVAKAQSKDLKRTWKVFSYPIAMIQAIRNFQPFFIELAVDGEPAWSGPVYQVSVANGRYHGGGLSAAKHAAIDDGKLDLYLIYPGKFWQLVACLTHLKFGLWRPKVLQKISGTRVSLRTYGQRSVNADGELVTQTPAEFSLLRQALAVVVPRS